MGEDIRLRALAKLAQAMAAAQRFCEGHPRHSMHREMAHAAAAGAREALDAAIASLSVWDRARGRLDVLVNVGELAPGESEFPDDESYPVHDFPEIAKPLPELGAADGGEPAAWIETADGGGANAGTGTACAVGDALSARAAGLRRRGRGCCVVAPIVVSGRAWGELYAARAPGEPVFERSEVHFATILADVISAGIAQNEQLEEVRKLAFTDELTGLANRRAVEARLDEGLERHHQDGTVVSLVVCDVNGLKRVNDEFGHAAGDRLLERFGMVLSLSGAKLPGALAARLGGDEFCLLAVGPPADRVVRAAEEVCRGALGLRGGDGVSCGVASTGDAIGPVRSAARLFRLADAAQYRAKAARALGPVVAGREGGVEDPVVRLADASEAEEAVAAPPPGDRRHFRGRPTRPDRTGTDGTNGTGGMNGTGDPGGPRVGAGEAFAAPGAADGPGPRLRRPADDPADGHGIAAKGHGSPEVHEVPEVHGLREADGTGGSEGPGSHADGVSAPALREARDAPGTGAARPHGPGGRELGGSRPVGG